jgi:hypothetical protein
MSRNKAHILPLKWTTFEVPIYPLQKFRIKAPIYALEYHRIEPLSNYHNGLGAKTLSSHFNDLSQNIINDIYDARS